MTASAQRDMPPSGLGAGGRAVRAAPRRARGARSTPLLPARDVHDKDGIVAEHHCLLLAGRGRDGCQVFRGDRTRHGRRVVSRRGAEIGTAARAALRRAAELPMAAPPAPGDRGERQKTQECANNTKPHDSPPLCRPLSPGGRRPLLAGTDPAPAGFGQVVRASKRVAPPAHATRCLGQALKVVER